MTVPTSYWYPAALALLAAACSGATQSATQPLYPEVRIHSDSAAIAKARADSARYPYTAADVHFMSGMIAHHAQAILMASWAPTHDAGPSVRTLSERIINAQQDEIVLMQQWLSDRRQVVPQPNPAGMRMTMHGVEHDMLMPGMLTQDQLKQLDQARGREFDRLLLMFMIQHHKGAVSMVEELFRTHAAGQDDLVFKMATDINVDQTTEIARMEKMLAAMLLKKSSP